MDYDKMNLSLAEDNASLLPIKSKQPANGILAPISDVIDAQTKEATGGLVNVLLVSIPAGNIYKQICR
jgi:hypothetical protein